MLSGPAGPGGDTTVAAVIGWPVRHSLSPAIHNAAFAALGLDWVFVALPVVPAATAAAIEAVRALGLGGLSVTMPHKDGAARAVDRLSADAEVLGAVNCVVPVGDELVGENTDGPGFIDSLRVDEGFDPAARRCVVVGAGGAARAVVLALAGAGAAEVVVVNRSPGPAVAAATLAGAAGRVGTAAEAADADLVVNATPVGMTGDVSPLADVGLGAGQLVVDLIYHPPITPLLAHAEANGASVANGVGMLVHQAAHAFSRWTGEAAPLAQMTAAALAGLAERSSPGN